MLSRTAADLYWMSRYLERAENRARMLDISYSLSLMPQDGRDGLDELAMPLLITGTLDEYREGHGPLHGERMLHFFALDPNNPSSIYSCLRAARSNAHAVRGRITADMWENINSTWLEMRSIAAEGLGRYGISRFCDWVKQRSHLFHGATSGTIMRHDAYRFISLGTYIERADNTLRLLVSRYEMLGDEAASIRVVAPHGEAQVGQHLLHQRHDALQVGGQRVGVERQRLQAAPAARRDAAAVVILGSCADPSSSGSGWR